MTRGRTYSGRCLLLWIGQTWQRPSYPRVDVRRNGLEEESRTMKKVRDIMTREVEIIHPTATIAEAAEKMRDLNVGPLPVSDGTTVLGMVTDRDITIRATAEGHDPNTTKIRDVMTPDVVYVYDDQDVDEAAKVMGEKQIRRVVVLNRDKRLVGIIATADIAVDVNEDKLSGQMLESISEPAHPNRGSAQR